MTPSLLERVERVLEEMAPNAGVLVLGGEPRRPLALRPGIKEAKVPYEVVVVLDPPPNIYDPRR